MPFIQNILNWLGFGTAQEEKSFAGQKIREESLISYDEIRALIDKDKLDKAKLLIDRERHDNPDDAEIKYLHAYWLNIKNRPSEAADILGHLIQKHPKQRYLLEYAHSLFAQGNFSEAEKYCREVLKQEPLHRGTLLLLTKILLSHISPKKEDWKPPPENMKDLYDIQVVNFNQISDVIPSLEKLHKQDINDRHVVEALTEIYALTGDQTNLRRLLGGKSDEFIMGRIKLLEGDYDSAANIFEKLVKEDNKNARRLQNYAIAEEKRNNLDKALRLFHQVLQLNPHNVIARRHFQHLAIVTENPQILEEFEKSLSQKERGDLFALYATILEAREQYEKALDYYAKAMDFGIKEKEVVHRFAKLASHALSPAETSKIMDKLIRKYPEDQELLDIYLQTQKEKMNLRA